MESAETEYHFTTGELVDIGCNLTHDSFDGDRSEVLQRARAAEVVQLIVTGASEDGSKAALRLSQSYPGELFATAGVHPHRADSYDDHTSKLLQKLAGQHGVVALGETGLDYFRDFSSRERQRLAFTQQLEIAAETGLPVFLHQRDAHHDFLKILKPFRSRLSNAVVHCFTGSREELHDYLELDCHIGITGWICDERRGEHLKEIVADIPANRLMVETDAPYLKPRSLRPKVRTHRNEPQWLPWIIGTLAACRDETPPQTARLTTRNARRFFKLPRIESQAAA